MFWYATTIASIVSCSPRLNRLVASWMLPALLLFSSDDFFPFRCRLSCILAYLFFQRFRWALDSASDAFKLLLLCRDITLSTFVPLVESGICLLVDVATLSTIYDVRHPLLLPPGYPTQELISRPQACLLYTSPSPRDRTRSRMPSSA